ncbi:MAG: OmpA family protein [Pseudomonadota bacterium]|nr:OmpA family protein [Pseudomonadota bacterium]
MRKASNMIALSAILLAALLAGLSAVYAANLIERRSATEIRHALAAEGITWAGVETDGLQVRLYGTAPTEAIRFRALTITGTVVDAARVIDQMDVTPASPVAPPRFSLELLRNNDGLSMIGLIPGGNQRDTIIKSVKKAADGAQITDMLDVAEFERPEGWDAALEFGLEAMRLLPRSKISISADQVAVTAISDSPAQKRKLEAALAREAPDGIATHIDISSPRPVIAPFTLRFVIGPDGARFDACSAHTAEGRERILAAARAAGLPDDAGGCTLGLGVPSPNWAAAVETGIAALARLGGGALTFSDADVTLVALDDAPRSLFDTVTAELEADLPEVFSLHAVLPEPVKLDGSGDPKGPPEFVATLSPEGQTQLRGRVTDEVMRTAAESYARSRFGLGNVYSAMNLDETLPDGWPRRVLTGLEGLAELSNGVVIVQPEFVALRGATGDPEARARIARLFGEKLGEAQNFSIEVAYEERLDPVASMPTPQECVDGINAILAEQKITFAPGSVTLEGEALKVVDRIASALRDCPGVRMEIGGHTDSQGREVMNEQLSQQRAEAVLAELIARRILTTDLTARGYGESVPIAENDTEDGREANRRIEFRLITPKTGAAPEEAAQTGGAETPDGSQAPETDADTPEEAGAPETETADEQD